MFIYNQELEHKVCLQRVASKMTGESGKKKQTILAGFWLWYNSVLNGRRLKTADKQISSTS